MITIMLLRIFHLTEQALSCRRTFGRFVLGAEFAQASFSMICRRKFQGNARVVLFLISAFGFASCLKPYTAMDHSQQPEVRVGLIVDAAQAQFEIAEAFSVRSPEGKIQAHIPAGRTWIVQPSGVSGQPLELRTRDGAQRFTLPEGAEINAHEIKLTLGKEQRNYHDRLRFHLTPSGKVTVVNILPVEYYLAGVLPAEMNAQFPLEALKAQAIAARSEVMMKLKQNRDDAIFDICGDATCQAYAGKGQRSALTDRAVSETFGIVVANQNRDVVNAPYASVCGGHTENNENIWSGNARPHLRGVFDSVSPGNAVEDLTVEENVRAWLASSATANCNLEGIAVPAGMAYSKKYFRWQMTLSGVELRDNIRKQTGEDFGDLLDLQAISRGVSGRITKLRVVGAKKSFEINRELAIRQALSPQTLWSSLFVVDKTTSSANGNAAQFIIRGAGAGHGVGMCQIGAAMMALRGSKYEAILKHYYSGIRLLRAY